MNTIEEQFLDVCRNGDFEAVLAFWICHFFKKWQIVLFSKFHRYNVTI